MIEGQNLAIESRFAEGKPDQLPRLAAELVRLKMDVIATWTTPAALAAKRATAKIPIVIGFSADPVGSKIVNSLARPGGNITGWTHSGLELRAKYLELLHEAVPHAVHFGVLWNPTNQVHKPSLEVIQGAAERLKVELILASVDNPKTLRTHFLDLSRSVWRPTFPSSNRTIRTGHQYEKCEGLRAHDPTFPSATCGSGH